MLDIDSSCSIVSLDPSASRIKAAQDLLREYGEFVLASTGPVRFQVARLDGEIADPLESYASRGGELLLAFIAQVAAGCCGFRALTLPMTDRACELKRLWVRPSFRGFAIGQRLADAVFERAAAAGYNTIYLDTEPHAMPAALRLYQRLGFEECAAYSGEEAAGLRFFRKNLS